MFNTAAAKMNSDNVAIISNTKEDILLGEDGLMKAHDVNSVKSNPIPEEEDGASGNRKSLDVWEDFEEETKCGIGWFRPQWLQKLANTKCYVLVYGLIGMLCDAGVGAYFGSTITTLEKRFKLPSRTSGLIVSAVDISGIVSFITLSYLGSNSHRTRWVACGILLVSLSCFLRLTPHLIFGPGEEALKLTLEYEDSFGISNTSISNINDTVRPREILCKNKYQEEEEEVCFLDTSSAIPTTIFFIALMIFGVGTSMYHTLGLAYLDDNAQKRKSPLLLAITQVMRMLGPTIGAFFGSYALTMYEDTSVHPTITKEDPRWIGAWWLGWGPFVMICLVMAFVLALFPRRLPSAAKRTIAAGETLGHTNTTKSFSDFKMVLLRLMKNKVLVFNSFSSVFFIFGLGGYWTFINKYLETQYRLSASESSLVQGSVGLIFSGIGILLSGIIITTFKPNARYIAGWNVIVESLEIVGYLSYGFLNCAADDLHGSMNPDNTWNLTSECNSNCDCGPRIKYSPICSTDGSTTFYSPCHAGCTVMDMVNGTKMFGNCSCIGEDGMGWAVDGLCPVDCKTNFIIFIVIQSILRILSSSGRAGNTMIQFRCVNPEDKAVSIGFTEVLLCALAFVPSPIIYGMLLDYACTVWDQTCGESGNCWIYDGKRLGFLLNFISSACLLVGTLLDVGVWYYVKDMQMYDKEDEEA